MLTYITSLCFSFLTCKIGSIIYTSHRTVVKNKWDNACKRVKCLACRLLKMAINSSILRACPFAVCLSYNWPGSKVYFSTSLILGMALRLALANRMWQKWSCVANEPSAYYALQLLVWLCWNPETTMWKTHGPDNSHSHQLEREVKYLRPPNPLPPSWALR